MLGIAPLYQKLRRYAELVRASWMARRFRATYEHLARDVAFHPEMDVRLDIYSPALGDGHPVLVFIHGGGWSKYHKELFAPVAMRLVPEDMVVVIPDHTLYPDASCEQMVREVAAAACWALESIDSYGGDPGRVVVAGHSSGAHLAGLALMDSRFLSVYGHSSSEVRGFIGVSGGYDLEAQYAFEQMKDSAAQGATELMRTMVGLTGGQAGFAQASPIAHVRAGLPPTLLIHGDADETVHVSQTVNLHASLQEAGAESTLRIYPGRGHSDLLFDALIEERPQIVTDMCEFVRARAPVRR